MPPLLLASGLLFLVLPFANYAFHAAWHHLSLVDAPRVLGAFSTLALALLAGSFVVGMGLLSVRKWGWWLFLAYSPALLIYDVVVFARHPVAINIGALVQTLVVFAAIGYLLRRDVYAPYLSKTKRGWRGSTRRLLEIPVTVDGVARTTKDFSDGGCYVAWPGCDRPRGTELRLAFTLGGNAFDLAGEIMRVDAEGAGVAFRTDVATARALKAAGRRGAGSSST